MGTETDGSIVGPAARNSIVGLKPTVGLISRAGIIPISRSQDSAGPMARTVRDVALLLGALTGEDPRDPSTSVSIGRSSTDYAGCLDRDGLRGMRIGLARAYMGFDERVDRLVEDACAVMRASGATIIDPVVLPEALRIGNADEREVLLFEFKEGLDDYLADLGPGAPVRSLTELIEYNRAHADLELSLFPQELLEQADARGGLSDPRYREALANSHRLSRDEGIDLTMDRHQLDAIVTATVGLPELADHTGASMRRGGGSATPSAMAGYPNMSVPMGYLFGLPLGLSLFGRAWSEPTLIRIAYAYEQTTQHRRQPLFLDTVTAVAP